ncbi:MAG: S8 family serine peptidase [Thermoplasmata archaeon]|nr:S8 family serine peptidase [Thermoplasmata archaeon]
MKDTSIMSKITDYIGFFYIFAGIITIVFTFLFIVTPKFNNILSSYTDIFGYYPSTTSILVFDIILGFSSIAVGIGLMSRFQLARIGAIILAVPKLVDLPYGVIVGALIIAIMVMPQSNSIFGKFSHKKVPFRVAGIILIAISFFAFAGLSGYVDEVSDDINIGVFGFPQSNLLPQEKIYISQEDIKNENDVIVELTAPVGKYAVQQQNMVYTQLESYGNIINTYSRTLNALHMNIPRDKLTEIASNPYVKAIYKNNINHIYYNNNRNITDVYGLDDATNLLNTHWLWENGYNGSGVVVAVIDTGINEDMQYLQRDGHSIVIASYEKYGDWVHWHGTAVASCIASQNEQYKGVAPMVNLIDVEVFIIDDEGDAVAYDSDILWGYEKVAEFKQEHPDYFVIASCSFGIPAELVSDTWSSPYPTSRGANNLALQYNIPVVASAGNDAMYGFKISAPASAQYVLAVGAVDKNIKYAYFSSQGPTPDGHKKPDVANIGVDVRTFDPDGNLIVVDGTSFSCPLTSGILADIATKDNGYTAIDYYNALRHSADDLPPHGFDYKTGYGFVDGKGAVEIIGHIPPKKIFIDISFAMIFIGAGIVFFPEWSSIILEERRKWIRT